MITSASPEWPAEKRWLEAQITKAHESLEDPGLSETQTALVRGQILAWRERIKIGETPSR